MARLVKDVFESAAGQDAVGAVSDYLRSQRVTSLADLQVGPTLVHVQTACMHHAFSMHGYEDCCTCFDVAASSFVPMQCLFACGCLPSCRHL